MMFSVENKDIGIAKCYILDQELWWNYEARANILESAYSSRRILESGYITRTNVVESGYSPGI